ncbi:MAG: carboxypeptidase-like regulatory domain-containing protein [Acidobacteriota bacterium]
MNPRRTARPGPRSLRASFGLLLAATLATASLAASTLDTALLPAVANASTVQPGVITGTVRDVEGAPIVNSFVNLWTADRQQRFDPTDTEGRYSFQVTPGITYYLTTSTTGYVDEAWDNLPCHDGGRGRLELCEPTDGMPLLLESEEVRSGIDFVLERQGTLQGRVVDQTGAPLRAFLNLFFPFGPPLRSEHTEFGTGTFELPRLDPGTYYLVARSEGYADQIWDGGACHVTWGTPLLTCDPAQQGTPLVIAADQTVSGITIQMQPEGSITGAVTHELTGEPVVETIEVYTSDGQHILNAGSNGGQFRAPGLNSGSYFLLARGRPGSQDWRTEIYDDIPCTLPDCDPTLGTPVAVTRGDETPGIDFALSPAGRLTGRLFDDGTGEGPVGEVYATVFDTAGRNVFYNRVLSSDSDPRTEVSITLIPGAYQMVLWGERYATEVYPDLPCSDPRDQQSCDPAVGTPVVIEPGADTTGVDLRLSRLPRVTSSVVDRETNSLLNSSVALWDTEGTVVDFDNGTRGEWFFDVVPGTYFATGQALHGSHVRQLFDDVVCHTGACDVTAGTPITVDYGDQPQVDFRLDPIGALEIELHPPAGFPDRLLNSLLVSLRTAEGLEIDRDRDRDLARFEGLGDISYRLAAILNAGYPPQQYPGVVCSDPDCSQLEGQAIAGRSGETQRIDWTVIANGTLRGSLRDATSGEAVTAGEIGFFNEAGELAVRTPNHTDHFYLPSPGPGRYRAAATAPGYLAHILGQGDCPGSDLASCDGTSGTVFELTYNQLVRDIEIPLTEVCSDGALCLDDGRFEVRATWRDFIGGSGTAQPEALTDQAGTFWFFNADNVELVVKVLDACVAPLERFWVFAAGLTDVEVELTVTDTVSGQTRTYNNALGSPFQPILDTDAFATCDAGDGSVGGSLGSTSASTLSASITAAGTDAPMIVPPPKSPAACGEPDGLCLGDRFRVDVAWQTGDADGPAIPQTLTADSGYFTFFSPDNLEMVIKVLDACQPPFERFWVFAAGLTDVGVTMTVTDTATGAVRVYRNLLGTPFAPIIDTDAFATCF